jgi:curli biogenesis system outer membrane secretion channel CsgG
MDLVCINCNENGTDTYPPVLTRTPESLYLLAVSLSLSMRRLVSVAACAALVLPLAPWSTAQAQTARTGYRPTVSVPDFKNNVTGTWWWQGPVAQDLSHALANELTSTGDLQVVERRNINQVLSEQELAELGIVNKASSTAASKGQMKGARYIVLGTITSYDSSTNVDSKGNGMSFLGFGGNKQSTVTQDYVAIDVRVVDSTTGEVVGARTVEGRASNTVEQKASGGSLLPGAAILGALVPMSRAGYAATAAAGTLSFSNNSTTATRTPAAKAIRAALIDASNYVSCLLVPKNGCMASIQAQDQQRRQNTLGTLKLE